MDFSSILNQVLTAGKELANQADNNANNSNNGLPFNLDMLKGFGGGAAATGLLSLLLGDNGFGKGILKLGSVAAIGSMAYSAWKKYQELNGKQHSSANFAALEAPTPEQNNHASQLMLKAMIGAAAADGVIDDAENEALLGEIGHDNPEIHQWLEQQLQNPPSAQEIATEVGNNPALAAQVYLASRIVCGDLNRQEIIYLHDLANALHLDQGLVDQLEAQAGF